MENTIRLAILGDFDGSRRAHRCLEDALRHAVGARHRSVFWQWIGTDTLAIEPVSALAGANAVIVASDDESASVDGVVSAIRTARERAIPLLAIGGAFEHVVREFARNVLDGATSAPLDALVVDHSRAAVEPERADDASAGQTGRRSGAFFLRTDSQTARLYGRWRAVEESGTPIVLDGAVREGMEAAGLRVTGTDSAGAPTVLELTTHPFFIAVQFEPQLLSQPLTPAPLIRAAVDAAIRHRDNAGTPHGLEAISA